jgi:hypothetical protein
MEKLSPLFKTGRMNLIGLMKGHANMTLYGLRQIPRERQKKIRVDQLRIGF